MRKTVIYITSSLPSLTSTFIYREITALERLGIRVQVVSMNRPVPDEVSEDARPFLRRVLFLDQVNFARKLLGMIRVLVMRPLATGRTALTLICSKPRKSLRDFARLAYHFVEAGYLSSVQDISQTSHIHAHFVTGPSSIAMYLSGFTGLPFSFTMHGSLIYRDPIGLLTKLNHCKFVVSVTEYHSRHVIKTYGEQNRQKIQIVRCGLLMEQFLAPTRKVPRDKALRILSVGRLIEVKGFEYLLRACAEFKNRGGKFSCQIVGDGPLRKSLSDLSKELELDRQVTFEGAKTQPELTNYFEAANVFCLPCVVGSDGSMDGLPVVLMEAMAWELPVISSRLAGIPELVMNYETGILVEPEDVNSIAGAFEHLRNCPDDMLEWGKVGRNRVRNEFNQMISAKKLATLFFNTKSLHL